MTSAFRLSAEFGGKRYERASAGAAAYASALGVSFDDLRPMLRRGLRDYLDTVAEAMAQRHSQPWAPDVVLPAGERTGRLARRSGRAIREMRRSVEVTDAGGSVRGTIGGPFYLVTHEEGRTIRTKRARPKYLTIPLPPALDARGVPLKRRARDWRDTFVYKSRRGNLLIAQRRGRTLVNLYVLKRSVRIPQRLGLGKTIELTTPVFLDKTFQGIVREINRRAGRG